MTGRIVSALADRSIRLPNSGQGPGLRVSRIPWDLGLLACVGTPPLQKGDP